MSRYTIELNDTITANLNAYADRTGTSRAEAARRAFALLAAYDTEAKKDPDSGLAIIDKENKVVAKLIGI